MRLLGKCPITGEKRFDLESDIIPRIGEYIKTNKPTTQSTQPTKFSNLANVPRNFPNVKSTLPQITWIVEEVSYVYQNGKKEPDIILMVQESDPEYDKKEKYRDEVQRQETMTTIMIALEKILSVLSTLPTEVHVHEDPELVRRKKALLRTQERNAELDRLRHSDPNQYQYLRRG